MTKKPAKPAWNSFTKAELIKTIKKLDARQTRLLNEIATLRKAADTAAVDAVRVLGQCVPSGAELDAMFEAQAPDRVQQFPWEQTP